MLRVGQLDRTYELSAAPTPGAPLLVALHGAGGTGGGMAALTGLHDRGPATGFTVAFPDGVAHAWNDGRGAPRLRSREGVDDAAFLRALVEHLARTGVASAEKVAWAGISNGAFLAEHLARHELVPVAALVLVAGGATVVSRAARPRPGRPTAVVLFEGTADPLVPYFGGPIGFSRLSSRRRGGAAGAAPRGVAVAADDVAADWAAANGVSGPPTVTSVGAAGDLPVTRLTWSSPGRLPVVLHRIDGGGHTWPGGAAYLPERIIGPVARRFDATGLALAFAGAALGGGGAPGPVGSGVGG